MDPFIYVYSYMDPLWTHSYTCNIYIHIHMCRTAAAPHPAPASGAQAGIYITKNDSDSIIVAGNRVKAMLYDSDMKAMILICIL